MAKKKKKSAFKKYDTLRLVGEPVMIIGHVATYVVGGPVAKAATFAGAAATTAWVFYDIDDFAKRRKKEARKRNKK